MGEQVTLYTSNNCPACEMAKRWLKRHNIGFVEINLSDHEEQAASLARMGLLGAPILEFAGDYILGFSPTHWARVLQSIGGDQGE